MKQFFLLFFLLLVFSKGGHAKMDGNLDCRFQSLFVDGDMDEWINLVDSLQKQKVPVNGVLLYAEYGLMGYYLSQKQRKEAQILLKQFELHTENARSGFPENATYLSFDAAIQGFRIALSPWRAPFIGRTNQELIEQALSVRKDEFLPLVEQANSLYFRPSFVGGDKQKAKVLYEKAFSILEKQTNCNWMYFHVGAWLGQVYTKLDEPQKAKAIYQKLLKRAPGFQYVRDELLPQLNRGEFVDIEAEINR